MFALQREAVRFFVGKEKIMRAKITGLILLLIVGVAASQAATGGRATLKINQQKTIAKTKLTIKLVSVEDSRCPANVQCIQAGEATVKIAVKNGKGARQTFDIGTRPGRETVEFAGYTIRLVDVAPHPAANVRIDRSGYAATFEVKK